MSLGGGDGDGSGGGLLLFPAENEVQGERDDDERERAACLRWLLRFFPPSARPPVLLPSFSLSKFQVDFKWRTSLQKAPKINHRHASMVKKDSQMDCPFSINGSGTIKRLRYSNPPHCSGELNRIESLNEQARIPKLSAFGLGLARGLWPGGCRG